MTDTPPLPLVPDAGDRLLESMESLNEQQRRAVETDEGPLLVLAGAGTGKTRVLTVRLARLLATGRAMPGQMLAVTFTNKAAREMSSRVAGLVGPAAVGMWIGTFHAIGLRILRRHAEPAGLAENFTILDADDQRRLAKDVIESAGLDEKRWPGRALANIVARWKDRGWTPEKVPPGEVGDFAHGGALDLYRDYQARLDEIDAVDFGDLLLRPIGLFTAHPDLLELYGRRFRHILVDEYQDTNVAQYLWLRLLAQEHGNICCVGDDDQSIYGWRGAEVGNILRFEKDFSGARIVRLEDNYRSTGHILGAASGLIAHNRSRLGKTLRPAPGVAGGMKVQLRGAWDESGEARFVGETVEALQRAGHRLDRMAILVRAGYQTRAFEERLMAIGIPYRVVGGLRFYERQEIRDAIAYLRLLRSDSDDLAFRRIANTPRRGLGERSLRLLHHAARSAGRPLMTNARALLAAGELPARLHRPLEAFIADVDRWRSALDSLPLPALATMVLDQSGLTAMWTGDGSIQAQGRLENLKELVSALEEFENLSHFLNHVSLVMDNEGTEEETTNILTLHGAKGLEFDTVFLPGWEEGVFPNRMTLNEHGDRGLEEERRLAYVGLTRARERIFVLHAAHRMVHGQWQSNLPSRFLGELPQEHVERLDSDVDAGGGCWQEAPAQSLPSGRVSGYRRAIEARRQCFGNSAPEAVPAQNGAVPAAGSRIFHSKFGYGRVMGADGEKLDIAFEKAGRRKVMAAFVAPV